MLSKPTAGACANSAELNPLYDLNKLKRDEEDPSGSDPDKSGEADCKKMASVAKILGGIALRE